MQLNNKKPFLLIQLSAILWLEKDLAVAGWRGFMCCS